MITLQADLAQRIVQQLARIVEGEIAITDENGIVVAATSGRFAGYRPHFALRVIKTGQLSEAIPEELVGVPSEGMPDRLFGLPVVYEDRPIGALLIAGERDYLRTAARSLGALAELLIRQIAIVDHLPQRSVLRDRFLADLFTGDRVNNPSRILDEAAMLGIDLATPRVALVVRVPDDMTELPGSADPPEPHRVLTHTIVAALDPSARPVVAWLGQGRAAVLVAVEPDRGDAQARAAARGLVEALTGQVGAPVRLGVGRYWPGLAGLVRSYREGSLALETGLRLGHTGPIYTLADVSIGVFLGDADEATKAALAEDLLAGLSDDLIDVATALFDADLSVSRAARTLYLHRHTLLYRLARLQRLTGRDLRRFRDALPIALALIVRRMARPAAEQNFLS